jgi:hypothetical protein
MCLHDLRRLTFWKSSQMYSLPRHALDITSTFLIIVPVKGRMIKLVASVAWLGDILNKWTFFVATSTRDRQLGKPGHGRKKILKGSKRNGRVWGCILNLSDSDYDNRQTQVDTDINAVVSYTAELAAISEGQSQETLNSMELITVTWSSQIIIF